MSAQDVTDGALDDDMLRRLADVGGVVFDVDGCLILSDQPAGHDGSVLSGAVETVTAIRESGRRVVAFTNASNRPPALIRASLNELGFGFDDGEVLTPSVVAAAVVRERFADSPVLAFGQSGVLDVLRDAGVNLVAAAEPGQVQAEPPEKIAAVVVGWDVAFDQVKLQAAAEAIWAGAPLLVTSDAPAFATRGRRTAGAAGFIATGLAHVTGTPYEVMGKPSALALATVATLLGVTPQRMLVAGDDLSLEVAMARRGGGIGVLVTTGMNSRADAAVAPQSRRPHLVVDSLAELGAAFRLADAQHTDAAVP